jgi:hypothetical protein
MFKIQTYLLGASIPSPTWDTTLDWRELSELIKIYRPFTGDVFYTKISEAD